MITKETKLMHMKFPWLLVGDETFWTNAKKRPLAWLCGTNTNNEILPSVNSFIPSAQNWVFHWLWTGAYPQLLDSDALKLRKVILVHQNENNWITLTSNLWLKNTRYCTSLPRLCTWHKRDRNCVTELVSHLHTAADTAFHDEITNWLYAFTSTIKKWRSRTSLYCNTVILCRSSPEESR